MIWRQPWAWIGLVALAVPLAVHLLTRQRARRQPFATIRFVPISTLTAVRRHRLTDPALFAVRALMIAAAVAALAAPLMLTATRLRDMDTALSRAVIIDTSASMDRATPAGRPARDQAAEVAAALTPAASQSRTVAHGDLRAALRSAGAWLTAQPGRREVVIVSDFQRGSMDTAALAAVPADAGVRLTRIDVVTTPEADGPVTRVRDRDVNAHVTMTADRTDASWRLAPAPTQGPASGSADSLADLVEIVTPPDARARINTAWRAARETTGWQRDTSRPVTVVFGDVAEAAARRQGARALDRPWMWEDVARLRHDVRLVTESSWTPETTIGPRPDGGAPMRASHEAPVLRDAAGRVRVTAAAEGNATSSRLVIFSDTVEPTAAAEIFAALGGADWTMALAELEVAAVAPSELAAWERPMQPRPADAVAPPGASDGRWLWLVVLILMAVEWVLRRDRPAPAQEVPRARVA